MSPLRSAVVDPVVLAHGGSSEVLADVAIVFVGLVYLQGAVRLWRERPGLRRVVRPANLAAGGSAVVVLLVALSPPVDVAAEGALWVHMCQHLAIGMIAPLAWCAARPVLVLGCALDRGTQHRVDRWVAPWRRRLAPRRHATTWALVVVAVHVGVWWFWHVPVLYDLAVGHDLVHGLEHAGLFAVGVLLWWSCLNVRWDRRGGIAVLALFGAAVGTGMIGALLTIAPDPVYATSASAVHRWGLDPLADQQLGGAIMWVGGGAVYLVAGTVLGVRWLLSGPSRGESAVAELS